MWLSELWFSTIAKTSRVELRYHPTKQPIRPPLSARRLRWLLALPKLGIVLLLAAVIALLWLLHQNELEEERTGLIKDVLWLEQNLRFQVNGNEERLQQLAADLGAGTDQRKNFRLRAGHILKNNPEE